MRTQPLVVVGVGERARLVRRRALAKGVGQRLRDDRAGGWDRWPTPVDGAAGIKNDRT